MADNPPRKYEVGAGAVVQRKSPLGYTETVVPPSLQSQYLRPGNMASTIGRSVYYRSQYADDPDVTTHERIHVGQNELSRTPTKEQIRGVLPGWTVNLGAESASPAEEPPAYYFSSPAKTPDEATAIYPKTPMFAKARDAAARGAAAGQRQQQDAYNAYVDLLYQLNPQQTAPVEAAMPDKLEREYVKTHPRPYAQQYPQMQEESLWHGIFGRGDKR